MFRSLLMAFLFIGSLVYAEEQNLDDIAASAALGGNDNLTIIKNATSITAQRVDSIFNDDPSVPLAERINQELKILGEPIALSESTSSTLQKLFSEGQTYLAKPKRCRFRANVRYAFVDANADKIDLVLCFGCGELEVWKKGELVAFTPFEARYGEILKVTQKIFPKDTFIAKFDPVIFKKRVEEMRK